MKKTEVHELKHIESSIFLPIPNESTSVKMSTSSVKTPKLIRFEVGGQHCSISNTALANFPSTPLASVLEHGNCPDNLSNLVNISETSGYVSIDANPLIFNSIIDTYRTGEFHPPANVCPQRVQRELELWQISESAIADCCVSRFQGALEDYKTLLGVKNKMGQLRSEEKLKGSGWWNRFRKNWWPVLQHPRRSTRGKVLAGVSFLLTFSSITTMVMGSYDYFREARDNDDLGYNMTLGNIDQWKAEMVPWLFIIDWVINLCLLVEFIARFTLCPYKKQFLTNLLTWIDIVAIFPVTTAHFLEWINVENNSRLNLSILILQIFMAIRVLRLLHLARIFPDIRILLLTITHSLKELCMLTVFVTSGVFIFGGLMFYVEIATEGSPFTNIPISFWWAIATMTTVGYGDVVPKSAQGKILAAVCACCGLVVVVLPIPIIANNFYLFYNYFNLRQHLIM